MRAAYYNRKVGDPYQKHKSCRFGGGITPYINTNKYDQTLAWGYSVSVWYSVHFLASSITMMKTSGSEPSSSSSYRSYIRNAMTHSESATAAQNSGLLSPPPSTRTSLDTLPTAPVGAVAACAPLPIHLSFNPLASPPESVAGSPLTKRCSNLLALQNFVRVGPRQEALNVEIKGVTPLISRELLKDLERYLVETSQGGTWESLL